MNGKMRIFSKLFRDVEDNRLYTPTQPHSVWMNRIDTLFVFLLAICPILQNYKGLLVDARATVLIICLPYVLFRFILVNKVSWVLVLPLLCFSIYKVFDGGVGFMELGREGLMCLYLLAAASNVINTKNFLRSVIAVSTAASILIIIQYFSYYICNHHLQLVPTSLFLDKSAQWVGLAETGLISITGKKMSFYRPSSFFLEPSHMALYCTPSVLFLLLTPKMDRRRFILAALITVGVMASTSGMGIMLCLGLWFLYFAFYFGENSKIEVVSIGKLKIRGFTVKDFRIRNPFNREKFLTVKGFTVRAVNIVFVALLVILVILMYIFVDVFRSSVNRIFFSSDGYNAIAGRTSAGMHVIRDLKGWNLIFGELNPGSESDWYMSAFFGTMYDYGLIGFVLSYIFYLVSLFKLKRQHRWMALMIIGLSFFSVHTHGSSYLLFFCIMLLDGHFAAGTDDPFGLTLRIRPFGLRKKGKRFR